MNGDSGRVSLPPFPAEYRASGVLLHVASLPSPYGSGDVGPAALAWVDRLHEAGQSWWQSLPLGPTGYGNSPYQSLSSFAGNELVTSPDCLIEDGLLQPRDCESRSFPAAAVDYDAVIPFKHSLLDTAWANFRAGARPDLRPAYEQFCTAHRNWLEDYALFRALKARHNGAYYLEWPVELVRRVPAALTRAREELAAPIDQVRFAQFLLFRQAERVKEHAHSKSFLDQARDRDQRVVAGPGLRCDEIASALSSPPRKRGPRRRRAGRATGEAAPGRIFAPLDASRNTFLAPAARSWWTCAVSLCPPVDTRG
jgi:4-alpha-glucanotransferase